MEMVALQVPNELWEVVDPRAWNDLTRMQKLEALNLTIVGLFMDEEWRAGHQKKIYVLDAMRHNLIEKNWVKPKWEDG